MSQLDLFAGLMPAPVPAPSKKKTKETPPPPAVELPKPVLPSVPYQKGSDTSKAAAESIRAYAPNQREKVFNFIVASKNHGCIDQDVVDKLGIPMQSVNPRRGELVKLGLIIDSRRVRRTKSGRMSAVWIANPTPPPGIGPNSPLPLPVYEIEGEENEEAAPVTEIKTDE